eukprot:7737301-Pyramimonas_sp.AAC.1
MLAGGLRDTPTAVAMNRAPRMTRLRLLSVLRHQIESCVGPRKGPIAHGPSVCRRRLGQRGCKMNGNWYMPRPIERHRFCVPFFNLGRDHSVTERFVCG